MAFFNQVTKAALALLTLPFLTAQAIFNVVCVRGEDLGGGVEVNEVPGVGRQLRGCVPQVQDPRKCADQLLRWCSLANLPDEMVSECEAEKATVVEMVSSLVNEAPNGEWLFIDSIADKTQCKFYELVLMGIAGYPFTNLLPGDEFHGNMTEILNAYSLIMNVTRFNIAVTSMCG
ncbi:hypothetical protein PC120_g11603 [Phytophthora cactorum]|nr:hypothetical protein PC120_g11603 [Phytophthora cactorum]